MNMQKVGMVSRVQKVEENAVMCCTAYTLCEVRSFSHYLSMSS